MTDPHILEAGRIWDQQCEAAEARDAAIEAEADALLGQPEVVERLFMDYPIELSALYCRFSDTAGLRNAMQSFLRSALIDELGRE